MVVLCSRHQIEQRGLLKLSILLEYTPGAQSWSSLMSWLSGLWKAGVASFSLARLSCWRGSCLVLVRIQSSNISWQSLVHRGSRILKVVRIDGHKTALIANHFEM